MDKFDWLFDEPESIVIETVTFENRLEVGTRVKVIGVPSSVHEDFIGEKGEIISIDEDDPNLTYKVRIKSHTFWFNKSHLEII